MSKCLCQAAPIFQPAMRLISAITLGNPTIITTTYTTYVSGGSLVNVPAAHQYSTGLIVRLDIPPACGADQLNQYVGQITVIDLTTFSLPVDSTNFEPFVIPVLPNPSWALTCAQVVPIGEDTFLTTLATQNVLPKKGAL
jgi:hypothetical protein